MQYIPQSVQSPILAQKLLSGTDIKSFDLNTLNGKIQANLCEPTMSNISTVPSFNSCKTEPLRNDFGLPVEDLMKLFERKAKSVFEKMLVSSRGKEILSKATQYNINFDRNDINWLDLSDEISEYEDLIKKCDEFHIDWDFSVYDPLSLEQEISFFEQKESAFNRESYYDFDRGVV